jgi:carbamoyltransferase
MGLAPYGNDSFHQEMKALCKLLPTGDIELQLQYFNFTGNGAMYTKEFCDIFGQTAREPETDVRQFHQDIAKSLQILLEECMLGMSEHLYSEVQSKNLCLAGGVALNCVCNSRILRDGPFNEVFVQPAAGDAGGCLGAAALAHVAVTGEELPRARLNTRTDCERGGRVYRNLWDFIIRLPGERVEPP